jgi:hypothetical protein
MNCCNLCRNSLKFRTQINKQFGLPLDFKCMYKNLPANNIVHNKDISNKKGGCKGCKKKKEEFLKFLNNVSIHTPKNKE